MSNAFEDGRAFLENLKTGIKEGRVSIQDEASAMEELKDRFREEYRKVWNGVPHEQAVPIHSPNSMLYFILT